MEKRWSLVRVWDLGLGLKVRGVYRLGEEGKLGLRFRDQGFRD